MDANLLSKLVPLSDLRADVRDSVLQKASLRGYKAGDVVFVTGDIEPEALYLVDGELAFEDASGKELIRLRAGEAGALYRMAHQFPRRCAARALSAIEVLAIDANLLDVMLTWDQTSSLEVGELNGTAADDGDWMTRLLQARCFQSVPPANLQAMFLRMQEVLAEPGEVIVRQGDKGDSFYVLAEGRAAVQRETPSKPLRLAELSAGDSFGEAAIISGDPRDATVLMLTAGRLMRLSRSDFLSLLRDPIVRKIGVAEAQAQVAAAQAQWLDVRLPSEARGAPLPAAITLPLYLLRMRLGQLDRNVTYIACCDTGRRSEVAAFVLTQNGFEAYALAGGLPAA